MESYFFRVLPSASLLTRSNPRRALKLAQEQEDWRRRRNKRDRAWRAAETAEQRNERGGRRIRPCRHAAQTVSEREATSHWKSTGERGAETRRREKWGTEVQRYDTLKEALKMWWNNLQFPHKTITHVLFIHTCPFLAQERLDPMILKDLEHHATRKLLFE